MSVSSDGTSLSPAVRYCNRVEVAPSVWDVTILFTHSVPKAPEQLADTALQPSQQQLVQGVVMSPQYAKAFSEILQVNIANWESMNGEIKLLAEITDHIEQLRNGPPKAASRLVEIDFPPRRPGRPGAAEWDKARGAFDERRYDDCVAECRDLLSMWNGHLPATEKRPLVTALAKRRRWPEADGRRAFIDSVWKAITDITNAPQDPKDEAPRQHFDAADARLILLLTGALSAYISE